MSPRSSSYENKVFRGAVAAAIALHLLVIAGLIMIGSVSNESKYKPLAVMDFAYYDPEGGEAGGGEGEEPSTGPTPGLGEPTPIGEPEPVEPETEVEETPPEPETSLTEEFPEPEPETPPEAEAEPEPTDAPEVITSASEEAAPLPPSPAEKKAEPKPEPKPKPKPKPKAQPKAKAEPKAESAAKGGTGGGALPGEVKPGGGQGSGRGGVGGGTGIGNPNALNAYAAKIRAKLNRLKKYPPAAASKQIGGVVTVNFTVNRQGAVISSRMVKSSGNSALDQEAMALLRRCSPFPAMPKELTQNTLNLTVPISFNPPRR